MTVTVEYTSEVVTPLVSGFFQDVALRTFQAGRFPFLRGKHVTLNAIAVSEKKIRRLNQTYRGKDTVTDILSFVEYADQNVLAEETKAEIFLGELFFSPAYIKYLAKEDQVSYEREMSYIFSHGVLHLLGYDHEPEMFAIQEKVTRPDA